MNNPKREREYESLSIQVSLDGFSFCAQAKDGAAPDQTQSYSFEGALSPENCLEQIQEIFAEQKVLEYTYENVHVVYVNELYTLVPEALFEEKKSAEYLKYNTKILSTDYLAHDLLEEYGLVCVYIPFTNINNYFFERFGTFEYLHVITKEINELLKNTQDMNGAGINIFVRDTSFDLFAVKGRSIQLCNTFSYLVPEDMAYHILFCYEQLGLKPDRDTLSIHGDMDEDGDTYQLLYTYIRNISSITAESPKIQAEI